MLNKGMTLIEVIIAMALLAIVTLIMFTVFGTTAAGIYNFGHETQTVFVDMDNMDEAISNSTGSATVTMDVNDLDMVFDFENPSGVVTSVTIEGNMMETNELDFEYFIKKE